MDKKMYKYIAILLGLIVLLVIFMWLTNLITGGSKLSYVGLEEKMVSATKKYVEKYPNVLPSSPNSSITISSTNLINEGYINELNSYLNNENIICNGSVEIFLSNDDYYDYVPNLSCGNLYSSIKLYDKVIADNEYGIVSGSGLYQRVNGEFILDENKLTDPGNSESFEYVFRGDEVNNFVKIDDN